MEEYLTQNEVREILAEEIELTEPEETKAVRVTLFPTTENGLISEVGSANSRPIKLPLESSSRILQKLVVPKNYITYSVGILLNPVGEEDSEVSISLLYKVPKAHQTEKPKIEGFVRLSKFMEITGLSRPAVYKMHESGKLGYGTIPNGKQRVYGQKHYEQAMKAILGEDY